MKHQEILCSVWLGNRARNLPGTDVAIATAADTVDDAFGGIAPCVLLSSASAATEINNVLAAAVDVLLLGVNKVSGDQTTFHQDGAYVAEAGGETMKSSLHLCAISKQCG